MISLNLLCIFLMGFPGNQIFIFNVRALTLYLFAVSSLLKFLTVAFCISGYYMYYPTQYRAATASLFEKATSMFSQRIQQLEEDRTRTEVKYDESPRLYVTFWMQPWTPIRALEELLWVPVTISSSQVQWMTTVKHVDHPMMSKKEQWIMCKIHL